jgi:hypothetical protein
VNDYHFPVDDRLTGNIKGARSLGKPFRPFQPVASVDLPLPVVQVDLDSVAVVLDFIKPLFPPWEPWTSRWRVGA